MNILTGLGIVFLYETHLNLNLSIFPGSALIKQIRILFNVGVTDQTVSNLYDLMTCP